jgi:hypothetical protein
MAWAGTGAGAGSSCVTNSIHTSRHVVRHTRCVTNGTPQILEGLATIVLGVCCFFWLIDAPALSTAWLDNDEMRFLAIQQRVKDGGIVSATARNHVRWTDIKMVLTDWRLYLQSYIMFCAVACSYGTSNPVPPPPSPRTHHPSNSPSTQAQNSPSQPSSEA